MSEAKPEFMPVDPDVELSPVETDRLLKQLRNELSYARLALRDARRKEIAALKEYEDRRIPLQYTDECPQPSRATGVTTADRDTWLVSKIPEQYWTYRGAKTVRECAEDRMRELRDQVKIVQSLNANARQTYDISGRS